MFVLIMGSRKVAAFFELAKLKEETKSLLINAALLFSFTVYTSMYTSLFQYFDCRTYEDGGKYLVIEPSIKCSDEAYKKNLPAVVFLCLIVTLGFPGSVWYLLWGQRKHINPIVLGRFQEVGQLLKTANTHKRQKRMQKQKPPTHRWRAFSTQGPVSLSRHDTHLLEKTLTRMQDELKKVLGDHPHLTSEDISECTELVERVYRVHLAQFGPIEANYWLQGCKRVSGFALH